MDLALALELLKSGGGVRRVLLDRPHFLLRARNLVLGVGVKPHVPHSGAGSKTS